MVRLIGLALAIVLLSSPAARAVDVEGAENLIRGMPNEETECAFLVAMCRAATASLRREADAQGRADFLASRQGAIAANRVDEAVVTADVIARKHGGRRLECFRAPECAPVLPSAPAPPKPEKTPKTP